MSRPLSPSPRRGLPPARVEQLSLQLPVGGSNQPRPKGVSQAARAVERLAGLDRLLSTEDVCRITGKHRCTLHRWMARGAFPKAARQQGQSIGWLRSDIEGWLRDRQSRAASFADGGDADRQRGAGDRLAAGGVLRAIREGV